MDDLREKVMLKFLGYDPENDHPRDVAAAIIAMVRAERTLCDICGKAPASIVECRECNHWANMEN